MKDAAKGKAAAEGNGVRLPMWGMIAALLLLPMVAMQFTPEMRWDGSDFAAAAVLLVGGGLAYELIARHVRGSGRRLVLGAMVAGMVGLIWLAGAAGIF